MRRCLFVVTASIASGCALFATRPPNVLAPDQPCNTSEATPIIDSAWAVLWGASTLIGVVAIAADGGGGPGDEGSVLFAAAFAGLHTYSARYGWRNVRLCRGRDQEIAARAASPPIAPQRSRRDDAWEATKRAQDAARAGDCATVSTLGEIVFNIDPEFHTIVFVRDAAIQRCLAPVGAAP